MRDREAAANALLLQARGALRSALLDGTPVFTIGIEVLPEAVVVEEGDAGLVRRGMLLGSNIAAAMREEGLPSAPGDVLEWPGAGPLFITGVLAPTGTVLDDLHVVMSEMLPTVAGTPDLAFWPGPDASAVPLYLATSTNLPPVLQGAFQSEMLPGPDGWSSMVGFHAAARLRAADASLRPGTPFAVSGLRLVAGAIPGSTRTVFDWFVMVPRSAIISDGKEVTS